MSLIKGVDYSRYQPHVNEVLLASQIDFAIIKATDGLGHDPLFIQNWKEARAAKIRCGAYHFARPGDGKKQAENFLGRLMTVKGSDEFLSYEDLLAGRDGILPPTVDAEWSPNNATGDKDT